MALQHRQQFNYPVIGITGSVGKTIVKEWLYHVINDRFHVIRSPKSYNSQLGVALSLLEMDGAHNLAIIEAGISKPDEMENLAKMIQPTLGVFTAFGSAHAHNFPNQISHLTEKTKLFNTCEKTFIGSEIPKVNLSNAEIVLPSTYLALLDQAPFQDQASRQNLSLVIAVASYLGLSDSEILKKLSSLPRLALRMETFDGINNNTIINDAYNADLDALTQSLEFQKSIARSKKRTAIIGIEGLDDTQVEQIKNKLESYQLDQYFLIKAQDELTSDTIQNQIILIKGSRASHIERIAKLFQLKKHKTRVEINLNHIKHNLNYFRSLLQSKTKILAMVKASSYGSGAEKIAEFCEKNGVEYLGVAYTDEGVELRKHGIKLPIIVMNAEEDSFDDIIHYNLEPSIYSFASLESFTKALINNEVVHFPIHLKFDTGMRRLGFESSDVSKVIDLIQAQPELKIQGVYSHLADSDNATSRTFTETQIELFTSICDSIQEKIPYNFIKHILNSEGIQRYPKAQFDMVRIGIGLYGISSNTEVAENLQQVIAWKTVVSQIKSIQAEESVGYGRTFIADKPINIGIIPVGYADGFRRSLSQGVGCVYVNGKMAKIVGNVCMDMIMVDLTTIPCKEGDEVEIIGTNQSVYQLAEKMQTIPYEVLTSLSKRLQRIYIEG